MFFPIQCLLETGLNPVSSALKDFMKLKHTKINRISRTKKIIFNMARKRAVVGIATACTAVFVLFFYKMSKLAFTSFFKILIYLIFSISGNGAIKLVCVFLYRLKNPQMYMVTRALHFSCTHVTLDKFS